MLGESGFNDLIQQEEKEKESTNDQTGLYNVLKNIQNRKCSSNLLCIEIGTINGPFDSIMPKNVTIMSDNKENVHVIIKPVILINNTNKTPQPLVINSTGLFHNEEDCDTLSLGTNNNFNSKSNNNYNKFSNRQRFKAIENDNSNNNKQRRFYRKLEFGNEIIANDIFKQGLNLIVLNRDKIYTKSNLYYNYNKNKILVSEKTFNTNLNPNDSDELAQTIKESTHDQIIILTGIGKWMGSITPNLIKEIKQIGGPDLTRLESSDNIDNSQLDHGFILIGRRGLCRYNGIYKVKNYDIKKDLQFYFPDLASDPNDCYFESTNLQNLKNSDSGAEFFHNIDLRLSINLDNDNRYSSFAPTIISVDPYSGPITGGQVINIVGFNFGNGSDDIKEVLVRGVLCKNVQLINKNKISCITRASTIMGSGIGNIIVSVINSLSSPKNTCSMFQYNDCKEELKNKQKENDNNINNNPYNVANNINKFEGNNEYSSYPNNQEYLNPSLNSNTQTYDFPINSFSFKENENNVNDIVERFNKNMFVKLDNRNVENIDNLITQNTKSMLKDAKANDFIRSKDGFRKRRFNKLLEQLEN